MMKKVLPLIGLLTIFSTENATAMIDLNRYSDKLYVPMARIEDQMITEHDLQQKMAILRMSGLSVSRSEALEHLIDQEIILYSHRDRIISQEAVNATIKKLINENNMTENEFDKIINEFGIDMKHLEKHIGAQLIVNDMIVSKIKNAPKTQRELYSKTEVTENEIKNGDAVLLKPVIYYDFTNQSQIRIAEIVVKKGKNVDNIIDMLRKNESFSKIQKSFPQDVELSGSEGDLGWLSFGEMSDLYKQAIKNTSVGRIAEPLISDNKLLFIKVLDVKNTKQSQKYLNPEYLQLSSNEKSDRLFNKTYANLISSNILNNLKKQLYIEIL